MLGDRASPLVIPEKSAPRAIFTTDRTDEIARAVVRRLGPEAWQVVDSIDFWMNLGRSA